MRETTVTDLWVGLFVVAVFGVFAYFIATFTAGSGLLDERVIIKTKFVNLAGLKVDGPVKLEGYSIGKIVAISHPKDLKEREVVVEMEVDKPFLARIEKDSLATIKTEGMLGDVTVEIKRGDPKNGYLKEGEFLVGEEYASLFDMDFTVIVKKVDNILKKIDEGGIEELSSTIKNLSDITGGIKDGPGPVHSLLFDDNISQDLKATANNISELSSHIEGILTEVRYGNGSAHTLIYGNELKKILNELEGVAKDLKDVSGNVSSMVGDLNEDKVGTNLGETAENLKKLSENLAVISNNIKEGEGTVGLLLSDPTVFEDLKIILGGAKRSDALRFAVQRAIKMKRKDVVADIPPEEPVGNELDSEEPAVVPQ